MRILIVHNRYQQYGGEDTTFESEKGILERHGHSVETLIFDNKEIDSLSKKLKLSYQLVYNRKSAKALKQAVKTFRPDVIHVYNLFYLASPAILIEANKHKVPVVVTLQNYRLICSGALLMRDLKTCELCINKVFPLEGIKYACHRESRIATAQVTLTTAIHKLLNTWVNKVTVYIAVTEFARNKFIHSSLKLPPEKVVVKPSSVPQVEPSDYNQREQHFLYVGRLSHEKGIETLLNALKNSPVQLEIIGDGPLKPLVEEVSAQHVNIRYLGYRDKSFIISRLRQSRALIVPSIWYECLPSTILEAFSTGTPVIISDIGNLNEIVSHDYNGIHFKTNDAVDLSRVIRDFDEHHLRYQPLYANARQTYVEKYEPDINYQNLIVIYKTAIAQTKKGG